MLQLDRSQYIRINDNMFLAKNDPDFARKYATYFPQDGNGLFKYAQQLQAEGRQKKADTYFARAEKAGSSLLNRQKEATAKAAESELHMQDALNAHQDRYAGKQQSIKRIKQAIAAAVILLLLLLALMLYLMTNPAAGTPNAESSLFGRELPATPVDEQLLFDAAAVPGETPPATPATEKLNFTAPKEPGIPAHADDSVVYTASDLAYLIALNGVTRFKEERAEFPESLESLTAMQPENWLSELPQNLAYQSDNSMSTEPTFDLAINNTAERLGVNSDDPATIAPYLFELHFFPASNELALMSGDKALAVYPVAAGKSELPPAESKVLSRVVEPNGEGSALGSRGLALTDNFAIHGTNKPELIGENVSDGCLRMSNLDVEALYPYVSKGTPFAVKAGTPAEPMFAMGLPVLNPGAVPPPSEMTPDMVYAWKN